MIRRLFGLHGKFVISLLVAAALPFSIGLLCFQWLAYRHMVAERGEMHQMEALGLVRTIGLASNAEAEKLRVWMAAEDGLAEFASHMSKQMAALASLKSTATVDHIDRIWMTLPQDDPLLRDILENPASDRLRSYRSAHPQVAEILMTDAAGRLIAATGKTSDYYQADESWWQSGAVTPDGAYWCDTAHYDESAGVFVVDVVLPIHRDERLAAIVKVSVEVAMLVPHLIMQGGMSDSDWYFVLRGGQVLATSDDRIEMMSNPIPAKLLDSIKRGKGGWLVAEDGDGVGKILGFAALASGRGDPNAFVVVSSCGKDVSDSLWGNFLGLTMAGTALLGLCLLVGFYIIQRKVLGPLSRIEAAVRSVSALAGLQRSLRRDEERLLKQHRQVEADLLALQQIRTGGQMEVLAEEISVMISRVLHYQTEIEKAEQMERDSASLRAEVVAEAADAEGGQDEA